MCISSCLTKICLCIHDTVEHKTCLLHTISCNTNVHDTCAHKQGVHNGGAFAHKPYLMQSYTRQSVFVFLIQPYTRPLYDLHATVLHTPVLCFQSHENLLVGDMNSCRPDVVDKRDTCEFT